MNAFTIDADNNITVHTTKRAARATGAGVFDTAEGLAELIGTDNKRLVGIWNSLTGVTPVKKFTSRSVAARRIFAEVQKLMPSAQTPGGPVGDPTGDVAKVLHRLLLSLHMGASRQGKVYHLSSTFTEARFLNNYGATVDWEVASTVLNQLPGSRPSIMRPLLRWQI